MCITHRVQPLREVSLEATMQLKEVNNNNNNNNNNMLRIFLPLDSVDETGSPQTRRTLPLARQKLRSPALKLRIEGILQPPASSFLNDLQLVAIDTRTCLLLLFFYSLFVELLIT